MILDILKLPSGSAPYGALATLRKLKPDSTIFETTDSDFNWSRYEAAGECVVRVIPGVIDQFRCGWTQETEEVYANPINGYFQIEWQGQTLNMLQVQIESFMCGQQCYYWLIADTPDLPKAFFEAVCRWNTVIRDEVFVFQEGDWMRDKELFQSIRKSRLDSLILPASLKETIRQDAVRFFAGQERYHQFNLPWKRGVIFIGPPGNGKTHMIQGLINELEKPCLYVKSLKARHHNEHQSMRAVFEKARKAAPCILVLEDLDTLIDDENRSYFLNELDGFRKNEGILTLATTNHPEKLDPSIVDRPSRFDRKFHFELPGIPERAAYLAWWNGQLNPELQLTPAGIDRVAAETSGFSFAYLKELALTSAMAWMHDENPAGRVPMDDEMLTQVEGLRWQMVSVVKKAEAPVM